METHSFPRRPCLSIHAGRRVIKNVALWLLLTTGATPVVAQSRPAAAGTVTVDRPATPAADVARWAAAGDSHGLPFIVVDKNAAQLFVFDRSGRPLGTAAALLGLGRGDDTVPGIGRRPLAAIAPDERTTPAGRFQAALGHDLEQDVLWIDYDSGLSLHRVIVGRPQDHRRERLASPSPLDNRISYGCINVPADFYDRVVVPAFTGTVGIVYILPETRALAEVFPEMRDPD